MKKGCSFLSGALAVSILILLLLILVYTLKSKNIILSNDTSENGGLVSVEINSEMDNNDTASTKTHTPDWIAPFKDTIIQDILPLNEFSRPGTKLEKVNAIVVHYVGNPGTTAEQNRGFYESIIETQETSVSSHYIVGMEGEIIQCVPLDEVSYASNNRNSDTIAVECCHPDDTGEFTSLTYASAVKLVAYLCYEFGLEPETDVIRHYDITGKGCPRYFVNNEDAWIGFKEDVEKAMDSDK